MGIKEWTTAFPGALDTPTELPVVVDFDDTRISQLNTVGTILQALEAMALSSVYNVPMLSTWASATTINFTAWPGQPATTRMRFQSGITRLAAAVTLTWNKAAGVGDLGYDEAASQGNSKWLYWYALKSAAANTFTIRASDNAPAVGPTGFTDWVFLRASYIDGSGNIFLSTSVAFTPQGCRLYGIQGLPTAGKVPLWNVGGYLEFAQRPYGFYSMVDNVTGVVLGVSTPAKVAGTTVPGIVVEFTHSDNRLTYTGTPTRTFHCIATLCLSHTASGSESTIYVAKNGAVIAASTIDTRISTGGDHQTLSCQAQVSLATNDYVEIWVESDKAGTTTVDDLQVYIRET